MKNGWYFRTESLISDEECALFRETMEGCTQLTSNIQVVAPRPIKPKYVKRTLHHPNVTSLSDVDSTSLTATDVVCYQRPHVQPRWIKRLKQGRFPIKAKIDLHGMTRLQSETALTHFLVNQRYNSVGCVLVIHGKGIHSEPGQVNLKNYLCARLPKSPRVLAFCSAKSHHGGTGALYVLLSAFT